MDHNHNYDNSLSERNTVDNLVSSFDNLHVGSPPEPAGTSSNTSTTTTTTHWYPVNSLINGVLMPGFPPLTYNMMLKTPIFHLEKMLGDRLYALINPMHPLRSCQIVNILLAEGIWDCYFMLQNPEYLKARVEDVVATFTAAV